MSKLKLSNYNRFVDFENKIFLIYNTHSGALVKTNRELFYKIQNINDDFDSLPNNVRTNLQSEQIIINSDSDEKKQIYVDSLKNRFSSPTLSLTIAPTLDCMFACSYCYEDHKKEYMSNETQEQLLSFLEQRLQGLKSINVVWYGGEPLMAKEIVFSMSDSIKKLCETYGVFLSFSMITNAYLLTKAVAKRMHEVGINSIQVTLDGPKAIHDSRRHLTNGGSTFATIVDNLLACEGIIQDIVIRVNVDKKNHMYIQELKDYLKEKGILRFADMDLSIVDALAPSNTDYGSECLSNEEFSNLNFDFLVQNFQENHVFPEPPRGSTCGAISQNGYIIGPDGSIYKCWSEIGNQSKITGHIGNSEDVTPIYYDWLSFNIFDYEECSKCVFLPMCMGACPDKLRKMGDGNSCTRWKYNFDEMILMYYLSTKANKEHKNGQRTC